MALRSTGDGRKLETGAADFLGLEAVLKLEPKPAKAEFPQEAARRLKIFGAAPPLVRPRLPGKLLEYGPRERRLLSEWYRSRPEPKSESDTRDRTTRMPVGDDLSIRGFCPDHLGFLPIPPLGLIDPRWRKAVAPHIDQVLARRLRIPDAPMHFYPWCTIGKVIASDPPYEKEFSWGSGFMFGASVMITARHLFPEDIRDTFKDGRRYRFSPAYDATDPNPEPFGTSAVVTVRGKTKNDGWGYNVINGWDYAICRLQDPIGDLSGAMGVRSYGKSGSYKKHTYYSAGYPDFNDYRQVWELGIEIRDVDGGDYERELETYNFASHGWSGGPLFGYLDGTNEARVIGVCSGRESLDSLLPPYSQCVWAGGRRLVELADWAVQNWWE